MIAVRLIGGLGNQMFQYAAGRALADRLGTGLLLDVRGFATYTLHGFGLTKFRVRASVAGDDDLGSWPEWQRRLLTPLRRVGLRSRFYAEPFFGYDPEWPALGEGVHLNGYFQSERYFSGIRGVLCEDFVPREPLDDGNRRIAGLAKESESVMLHVRRGDYVSDARTLSIHGVCSPAYYQSAVARMREHCRAPRFFVFSNDMAWARENLALGDDAVFVEGNARAPEMDVHLMAQCRHHIIANSSFSWWGAWLGCHPEQRVIAPAPWFDAPHMRAADLLPPTWETLRK